MIISAGSRTDEESSQNADLGDTLAQLERTLVKSGTSRDEPCFEVEGRSGEWKWEITVSASGHLLEVEREKRRQRS